MCFCSMLNCSMMLQGYRGAHGSQRLENCSHSDPLQCSAALHQWPAQTVQPLEAGKTPMNGIL